MPLRPSESASGFERPNGTSGVVLRPRRRLRTAVDGRRPRSPCSAAPAPAWSLRSITRCRSAPDSRPQNGRFSAAKLYFFSEASGGEVGGGRGGVSFY